MIDFGVAFDKLAQFETANDLADYLKSENVKGYKGDEDRCAIAVWLTDQTGDAVSVSGDYVSRYFDFEDDVEENMQLWELLMEDNTRTPTPAMMEFISRFDDGDFPELVLDYNENYFM